ncbi:MAG: DUF2125 domain-containing protein [Aestuariivirgaceae bacterium]
MRSLWPVAPALVLFALISGGWFWVQGEAQARFAEQKRHLDRKPALTCSDDTWSGYPFQMKLDCKDPVIHLSRGRTQLTPKTLNATVRAPSLRTVIVRIEGPTVINNDRLTAPVEIGHAPTTIRVHLKSQDVIRAETELAAIEISQSGTRLADIDKLELGTRLRRGDEHDIDIEADITNLILHADERQRVILAAVDAVIRAGNVPREPAANGEEWLKAAASLDTQFNVEQFKARYGATELHAEGTVTIEGTGTLEGTVKTRVTKLDAFLGELQQRQMLTPKKAKAAATLLGLFDKGNGVAADLRLKGGEFFWGPLKLGRQIPLF